MIVFEKELKDAKERILKYNNIIQMIEDLKKWMDENLDNKEKFAIFIFGERCYSNSFEFQLINYLQNGEPVYCDWINNLIESYKNRTKDLLKDRDIWKKKDYQEIYNLACRILEIADGNLDKASNMYLLLKEIKIF